jgi:hypothetical protein
MDAERHIKVLQMMYAGVLADSVLRLGKEGLLEKVTMNKHEDQLKSGRDMAKQLGITQAEDVFTTLSDIFNCADWTVTSAGSGFTAIASRCILCSLAQHLGAQSPCHIYCLHPMEGMVKGLNPDATYDVEETLWDGAECRVAVKS